MSTQYVVATITADPQHAATVEAALVAAVPAVRARMDARSTNCIGTAPRFIASRWSNDGVTSTR